MGRALLRLRNAIVTAGLVIGHAAVSFRYNWGIAILSIALAVSLWVFVTDREDPDQTGRLSGIPVECVNVPLGKAEALPCSETKSVTVRVRAPESVFDDLTAEDFLATADLSEVTTDEATVLVRVESTERRVEIVEVSPSQVTVRLENLTSKTVPVRTKLVGTPPRGFEASEPTLEPEEAVVTGPESLVGRVEAVEADVNLTALRTAFQQTLLLQARDEQGGNVQGVNVEPESADVRVEILQLEFTAGFIVRPDISGIPADGYSVTAIQVEPPLVGVTGPAEVFQTIDPVEGVMTANVSIDGASIDVVRTVALQLPEGATVEQSQVTVRVLIGPTQGAFTFSVPIEFTNVAAGLRPTAGDTTVQVRLSGLLPDLNAIGPGDLAATVNLNNLEAGEFVIPVRVQTPSGVTIGSITPATVRVTLAAP